MGNPINSATKLVGNYCKLDDLKSLLYNNISRHLSPKMALMTFKFSAPGICSSSDLLRALHAAGLRLAQFWTREEFRKTISTLGWGS
jgi:hypothetical protein